MSEVHGARRSSDSILGRIGRQLIFRQVRVGRDGRRFVLYKIRTMAPHGAHAYRPTEADDPRIYPWARWIRRWGIDELPQIVNLLKGELAIIGPRPLTEEDFLRLPADLRELRCRFTPGFINPKYAALRPFDWDTMVETERAYLRDRMRRPLRTDIRYVGRIAYNVIFKGVRSR